MSTPHASIDERAVLAGVGHLERLGRKLRLQARQRIVDGRSNERDLRLAYELHKPDIARRLHHAQQELRRQPIETTDSYRPQDPFQAFAIEVAAIETRPDEPPPRGIQRYIQQHLDTETMRRTKRETLEYLVPDTNALATHQGRRRRRRSVQNRTTTRVPESARSVPEPS